MNIERRTIPKKELTMPEIELRFVQQGVPSKSVKQIVADMDVATDRGQPIGKRIAAFVRGESAAGSVVGALIDVVQVLLPGGVKSGRQAAQLILQRKENTMPILDDKAWYESKSMWSAILFVLIGILNAAGASFVADPELMDKIYHVAYSIVGAFGLYGLRDAIGERLARRE